MIHVVHGVWMMTIELGIASGKEFMKVWVDRGKMDYDLCDAHYHG